MIKIIFFSLVIFQLSICFGQEQKKDFSLVKIENQLATIYEKDQGIRRTYLAELRITPINQNKTDSLGKIMMTVDSINAIEVGTILNKLDSNAIKLLNNQAIQTIFAVVQHSSLAYQEKYFPIIKRAFTNGQLKPQMYVMLLDRIEMNKGNDQIYGTQLLNKKNGPSFISPVFDPINLDKRRADVGLPKMEDYVSRYQLNWNIEDHIKNKAELKKLQLEICGLPLH